MFVRKKSKPEQPFYTMEYQAGHIRQGLAIH
ncbi:hypothetical protein AALH12_07430 [Streptococcus ferus]